jgi:DNA gyrase subunit A
VNNEPKVLNLYEVLNYYLIHQEEVVERRTRYDLNKAEERAHILQGLLIALDNIDEVISIIRSSQTTAEAKTRLMERFALSDAQAQAIVDMRLRTLTGLEREKLHDAFDISMEDMIPVTNTVITMTNLGYIKRMSVDNFKAQNRGGKGIKGMETIEDDYIEELLMTTSHNYLMFFTNFGRVYRMKAYEIPEASRTARGTAIINLLQLLPDEKITAVIPIREYNDHEFLFMATRKGIVKKTSVMEYANIRKNGLTAINLRDDDELIEVKKTDNTNDIFLVTKFGQCIRFHETDVRKTGRASMGVIGMNLADRDEVVGMQLNTQGDALMFVSEKGLGKCTMMSEFTPQNRGGKGVKCYKITEKTGYIVGVKATNEDDEMMMITTEGIIIRIRVGKTALLGRITSGVKLMDLKENVTIASIAKVRVDRTIDDEEEEK